MINNVSQATKAAIARKSVQSLPNNPSEKGYSAEEIKRRFYQPTIDATNSTLSEIDRVVNEANMSLDEMKSDLEIFIDTADIREPYKIELDNRLWVKNDVSGMYEFFVLAEEHQIPDYSDIGVDMFLLDGDGNYTQVNQFEISLDGTVRCFHENNSAGYLNIYIKREGLITGKTAVEAKNIKGLALVGLTNDFTDLDNLPDLSLLKENEVVISNIISGNQKVGCSVNSDSATNATNATYAQTSGSATKATNADNATKATQDGMGNNIVNTYAKQNGTYTSLTAGNAINANNDKNGSDIVNTYAKQTGTYSNMTVGKAATADQATNAEIATKALQDSDGNIIQSTYAKQTGNYPGMAVGNANVSDKASNYAEDGNIATKFQDIEERLKSLGFKEGAATFNFSNASWASEVVSTLTRQGNYVIFNCSEGCLCGTDCDEIANQSHTCGLGTIIIPEGFRPKKSVNIVISFKSSSSEETVYIERTIGTDGVITVFDDWHIDSVWDITIKNVGWETN